MTNIIFHPGNISSSMSWYFYTIHSTRDELNQVGYQLSDQDVQSVRDLLRVAGLNPANYQLTA